MKVVFLNRFFYPDISPTSQILSDLAFHLAGERTVHVITSRIRYDSLDARLLPASERIGGVHVHRVWTSRFRRHSLPARTLDYGTFYISAAWRLLTLARRGDVIVAMTDPPLMSVMAAIIGRLRGAAVVNWLQDLFPEVAAELDFKRIAPAVTLLTAVRNRAAAAASSNVVLGEVMAQRVASQIAPERIAIIPNWAAGSEIQPLSPESNPLRREWGLDGRFVVGYSGNMGRAHELTGLLEAAGRLRHRPDIAFLLVGGGRQRTALEAEVRARQLDNVIFRPYQLREQIRYSLTAPDCHIVSLKPQLEGLIVPSKLYSSLAAGRPIIFIGDRDGEIGRLMRDQPTFGVRVASGDVDALTRAIVDLADHRDEASAMGRTGRQLFERAYDRPIALQKWSALINDLCPGA